MYEHSGILCYTQVLDNFRLSVSQGNVTADIKNREYLIKKEKGSSAEDCWEVAIVFLVRCFFAFEYECYWDEFYCEDNRVYDCPIVCHHHIALHILCEQKQYNSCTTQSNHYN